MLALVVLGSPVTSAQGAVSDAFCAALTLEEVGAALGVSVVATPDPTGCSWATTDAESFSYLGARWESTTLEDAASFFPGGASLTVAGHPAYYTSDYGLLYVQLDQGVLALQLSASGDIDQQAALEGLAGLIVSRAGTLPPPATPEPAPTYHADPGLEALFPASVGSRAIPKGPKYSWPSSRRTASPSTT
jgi:hypothetical protein